MHTLLSYFMYVKRSLPYATNSDKDIKYMITLISQPPPLAPQNVASSKFPGKEMKILKE